MEIENFPALPFAVKWDKTLRWYVTPGIFINDNIKYVLKQPVILDIKSKNYNRFIYVYLEKNSPPASPRFICLFNEPDGGSRGFSWGSRGFSWHGNRCVGLIPPSVLTPKFTQIHSFQKEKNEKSNL